MSISEWERGYRDGLSSIANLIDHYIVRNNLEPSDEAWAHLRALRAGLQEGVIARDVEGRGE